MRNKHVFLFTFFELKKRKGIWSGNHSTLPQSYMLYCGKLYVSKDLWWEWLLTTKHSKPTIHCFNACTEKKRDTTERWIDIDRQTDSHTLTHHYLHWQRHRRVRRPHNPEASYSHTWSCLCLAHLELSLSTLFSSLSNWSLHSIPESSPGTN